MALKNFIKKLCDTKGGKKVSKLDMIALGIGDFGYSIVSCTVATYIVSFGTMALPGVGVGFATLMGIATGIAVIFDAISDPIMGYISDNFNSKIFGKRHLFMLIGLIGMMASAVAVWYVPYGQMSDIGIFFWFAVFLILLRTFNTMYYTPVGAFSVEISNDYNERTTIQAVRSVFYIVGMLLPVVLMGSFQNKYAGYYSLDGTQLVMNFKNLTDEARIAFASAMNIDISAYIDPLNAKNILDGKETIVDEIFKNSGYAFRKGQQIAQGYKDFSIVGTVICVVTSAIMLLITRRYVKILRDREEREAELKGIDLNAPKPKFTMEGTREEMRLEGCADLGSRAVRKRLRQKRENAGQITMGAVLRNFFSTFKIKEMRIIAIGYVIAMMSATLIISLGFNVFTFTFALTNIQMYVLMGALLLMTIGCQPVWAVLAKKKSKQFSMFTGLIISFIGCVLLFIAFLCRGPINNTLNGNNSWLGVVVLAPSLMIAGAGTGVLYSMPLALVGDVVVIQKYETGEDKTGTYAGVMTFCYKAGQGIVTAVSTALLGVVGFVSGQSIQTKEASDGIGWILCVGVVVFVGLGILIFSRLKLDKEKISMILKENEESVPVENAVPEVADISGIDAEAAATNNEAEE